MRICVFFLCAALAAPTMLRAENPGAAQDAEAAREKLLKASDELDNIQANSENTRAAVDAVKTDVASLQQNMTALQTENATLKQQLADLQAEFAQYKADQAKERQKLIDNVADLIAQSGGKTPKKKKSDTDTSDASVQKSAPARSTEVHTPAPSLAPPPDNSATTSTGTTPPPAPKKQKGYYHVVVKGETVSIIAAAYRDAGVKVTSAQIRKANGLTPDSELTPGQKLFIPKPGT